MKLPLRRLTPLLAITLVMPATADVIYSDFQNIPIPTNFTGVTIAVAGGTINPFFGGVGVVNNNLFQPARDGTADNDTIQNFAVGSTIDVSQLFATGYGGSTDHLGSTFTAGTEGYLGFKAGSNYGWMRVVFTANTAGAVVKDWAYDNSGAAIVVGRVNQSAPSAGTQTVTLSPAIGESFTLGSQITNTGGNINSVVKTGGGTTTLTGANTYTGSTNVNTGSLLVDGSTHASSAFTVAAPATLGGTGSIGGAVNVSGVLSPGAAVASLATGALTMNTGSALAYQVGADHSADLVQVNGMLSLTGVALNLDSGTLDSLGLNDWSDGESLTLISYTGDAITSGFTGYADDTVYTFGSNEWLFDYNNVTPGSNFAGEATGGYFVTMTLVPEPGCALLGGLGLLMLWRRRRA